MAKILLVDDEQGLLNILRDVLEDGGHSVVTAAHGEEALEVVQQEMPQLVISDIMMPIMDGVMLLQRLRQHPDWNAIKVILISAAPIRDREQLGADGYLKKPYDINAIEALVGQLLT